MNAQAHTVLNRDYPVQFPGIFTDPSQTLLVQLVVTVMWLFSGWSTISNGALIWVTVRQRASHLAVISSPGAPAQQQRGHMNSFARVLLLLAGADFGHSLCTNYTMWLVWRKQTIGLLPCYRIMAAGLFALDYSVAMTFVMSTDRLLSVVAPIWHRNNNLNFYIPAAMLAAAYSGGTYIYGYVYNTQNFSDLYSN